MKIVTLGNRGYLGLVSNKATLVLSRSEALSFGTKRQAERKIGRLQRSGDFDVSDAKVDNI